MLGRNLLLSDVTGDASLIGSPMNVHLDTLVLTGVCMTLILAVGSSVARTMVVEGPGGPAQAVVEGIYGFCDDLAKGNIGEHYKRFFPLIAAIFIFVLIGNFIGVGPWKGLELVPGWFHIGVGGAHPEALELASPTTDFNVTLGLAAISFITYLGSGFWKHGSHFAKVLFFSPMSWIEWMDSVVRPATLALRLMVVITADELMRAAFLMICPYILPTFVMAFELFIGCIQALVFALLTSVYIGLTVAEHH
jgi:F-type H+-transporting ATPase subunit a